jgi:predicted acyltransferase
MLLVNNPGTWSAIYWPLGHAEWHGWTPTDLIFPFFLFIVGVTTELSLRGRPTGDAVVKIIRRGLLIVLFGLLLNAFPFSRPIDNLRIPGVLQRIGVVYMIAALVALKTTRRQQMIVVAVILLGYWAIITRGPLEPPSETIAAATDRAVIGEKHLWSQSKTWDPEGVLSTIPAIATGLLGILVAPWVREKRVRQLVIAGAAGLVAGLLWDFVFPINKALWTSSYVVFTAGFACVMLALCIWIIDIRGWRGWTKPFVIYGVNPLIAFVGSGIMAKLLDMWRIKSFTFQTFYDPYFPPKLASLLWGLTFVLFWLAVLWVFYRRRWFLRV